MMLLLLLEIRKSMVNPLKDLDQCKNLKINIHVEIYDAKDSNYI